MTNFPGPGRKKLCKFSFQLVPEVIEKLANTTGDVRLLLERESHFLLSRFGTAPLLTFRYVRDVKFRNFLLSNYSFS